MGEVVRASRRTGPHHWKREIQMSRGPVPAFLPWNGILRYPRDHLQLHHEVRRGHQEGPLRQHCLVRWHHHVPRYRRQNAEGDHRPGPQHNEDQDHRSPREEVLCLHRRIHPCFFPPPSSRCGSPSRSTTSPAPPSCTGSASKMFLCSFLLHFDKLSPMHFSTTVEVFVPKLM